MFTVRPGKNPPLISILSTNHICSAAAPGQPTLLYTRSLSRSELTTRNRTALNNVRVTIAGVAAAVAYARPQGAYEDLDQVHVSVPHSVAGRGQMDVVLTVDGQSANAVTIAVR